MRLIFCSDPLSPRDPDPSFEREVATARDLGLDVDLIDQEALVARKDDAVVRRVAASASGETAVLRGWMLKPAEYERLYGLLLGRGLELINTPQQYVHCHHLPESLPVIRSATPQSVWFPVRGPVSTDVVMSALEEFGGAPVIVKDYVKSRKHEWNEACFIPRSDDRALVERVVRRFLELQGDDLNEGLVFRRFEEFESIGQHPKSGTPLYKEFRQFFVRQRPIAQFRYWAEGQYPDAPAEVLFRDVAQRVQSNFFSMDVARTTRGEWRIVELGDGQVTGLPETADLTGFYRGLAAGAG